MTATTVYAFQPLTPAGTAKATPQTLSLAIPVLQVDRIEIKIPHGPNGNLGFQLAMGGQQIIPYQTGLWLIGDDDDINWELTDLPNSGAWQFISYNTGIFDHTVFLRFHTELVPQPASQAVPLLDPASLSPGP